MRSFLDYFDMVPATTDSLKEFVFGMRYQVFCEELNFFNLESYPDGLERDEYDVRSDHFLIRHRKTGAYAATTRLILADPDDPGRFFPIEEHSKIYPSEILKAVPRNKIAEASRYCVSANFKRRAGEKYTLAGIGPRDDFPQLPLDENQRRTYPNFALPLIACVVRMSVKNEITHLYAFMEHSLFRLFRGIGIEFIPIGPLVDCWGMRQPYVIKLADLLSGARSKDISLWEMLTNNGMFWGDGEGGYASSSSDLEHLSR